MKTELTNFYTPDRFKGRTGIQIFVDRFYRLGMHPNEMQGRILKEWGDSIPNWQPESDGEYRNNYFYGGNLQGIISKLDYIEGMGFNLIYLSPISFSTSSHHYDVEDQTVIDPWIGTWEDFAELCYKAHERDILIVVDLVFNHMGANSKFFKEALQDRNSKYYNWFEWNESGEPVYWYNFKDMPQCNKLNPGYQEYTCHVAEVYIKHGSDGIRLDLGEILPKDFMMKLRNHVKTLNPEILIVNEMWGLATERQDTQFDGKQADSVMNYPLSDAICRWVRYGNEKHFSFTISELEKYPIQVQDVLWNFLDSHDTPRASNMLAANKMLEDPFKGKIWDIEGPWRHNGWFDTYGFRKWEAENDCLDSEAVRILLKMASAIQYFMPGIPIVYAGTEIGMTGYKDPFNRKPYNWENPDKQLQEHYCTLGKIRKENLDFFGQKGELRCEVSQMTLKLTRISKGKMMFLTATRNPNHLTKGWEVEIFEKLY